MRCLLHDLSQIKFGPYLSSVDPEHWLRNKSRLMLRWGCAELLLRFSFVPQPRLGARYVVSEMFFKRDYARCMGAWALMVTLGVSSAPFIFGFVVQRVGYRWIYWTLAIVWQPF